MAGSDAWTSSMLPRNQRSNGSLEQLLGDLADLYLLAPLGDPVAAMVPVDVLKGHVTRVADPAAGLHRPVSSLAREPVGPVVGHRHQMRDLHVMVAVEL